LPASAIATRQREDGTWYPWDNDNGQWQEEEMNAAGVKGWYLPVGPTGIRAMITHDQPCFFKVMYVFKNTPAYGKVKPGDVIIGANGMLLNKPHDFGRGRNSTYEGPWTAMAPLIEDSQGKDGTLELIILPGGKKPHERVEVKIPAVGRFSPTFPYDCERSDKLISFLCAYLEDEFENHNARRSRGHIRNTCGLALMASGEKRYDPLVRSMAERYIGKTVKAMSGTWCWGHGYAGVFLGEYYLRYRDSRVLPYMDALATFYADAIGHDRGCYSHETRPAIIMRVSKGGGYGYGAMSAPGGLAMLAMSLFKTGGLPYDEFTYERIHQAYLRSAEPDGMKVGYGFRNAHSVHVELMDPSQGLSGRGPGFRCPTGMRDITEYKITGVSLWNQSKDSENKWAKLMWRDLAWVENERSTNIVVEWVGSRRHIIRAGTLPEPTAPYNTTAPNTQAATGLGALAHTIGNHERPSWRYLGVHAGNSCALGYNKWFDGHACGSLHQTWVALGASRADKAKFRKFMDGVKWWFIMQQSHDGSYMTAPNRDRPSGCNKDKGRGYGLHTMATANAALLLAVARRQLQMTGAEAPSSSGNSASSGANRKKEKPKEVKAKRKPPPPRSVATPDGIKRFDERLLASMAEFVMLGKRLQFHYSGTRALVLITSVTPDGNVGMRGVRTPVTLRSTIGKLNLKDKAALALAVLSLGRAAEYENAAFYLKAAGRDGDAKLMLQQAGDPAVVLSGFSTEPAGK
jgi:hypothetical protein